MTHGKTYNKSPRRINHKPVYLTSKLKSDVVPLKVHEGRLLSAGVQHKLYLLDRQSIFFSIIRIDILKKLHMKRITNSDFCNSFQI